MTRRKGPGLTPRERMESLLADLDALPARRGSDRRNAVPTTVDFLTGAYGLIVEASRARRLSIPAYLRRAGYAMACHDLGLPLSDALARDARMSRETGFSVPDPDGDKFGRWEIERLVGEDVNDPDSA